MSKKKTPRPEEMTPDDVQANPKKASFWSRYRAIRAGVKAERALETEKAGPEDGESAEAHAERVAQIKLDASHDLAVSNALRPADEADSSTPPPSEPPTLH